MKYLAFIVLIASASVMAGDYQSRSGSHYDYQSGNSYYWNKDSSGNTRVRGYNLGTGSMWNTQIDRNGNQRGYDADNNYWNYNKNTKTYYNYGTGKMCTGEGYSRICN